MPTTHMPGNELTVLDALPALHRISIVIPVYRGETTLPTLLGEVVALATETQSDAQVGGALHQFRRAMDKSPFSRDALAERGIAVGVVISACRAPLAGRG